MSGAAFVLGGRAGTRPERASVVAIGLLLLLVALPLRGLFHFTGSPMEEGFMLVFPERILAGDVANVDFLHLYGPFSLHVLSAWYWLVGATLSTERLFGLCQHLGIIFGMYTLARAWGHRLATVTGALCALLVLTPIGLSALAWEGGVALALWSVILALRARHLVERARLRSLLLSGLMAGCALSYRPDLVLALVLAHGTLLSVQSVGHDSRQTIRRWASGLLVGLIPTVVHVAIAGVAQVWRGMFLDPVFVLRPGRSLPRPPDWSQVGGALQAVAEMPAYAPWWGVPAPTASQQLVLWFWMAVFAALGLVLHSWRRRRDSLGVVLLAGALLGLGLLPQALQRPDSTHLAWGSCVSIPLLIVAAARARGAHTAGAGSRRREAIVAVGVAAVLLTVFPFYTLRYYLLQTRASVGHTRAGFQVHRADRWFVFGNEAVQRSAQGMIDDLDRLGTPGQRLLVGPADLSRTIYSDAIFYHLFPELIPATPFIEMDPGLADREGSSLAADVASADWLILTNFWTGWYEPNASSTFASQAPNRVVMSEFCLVGDYENALVLLYRHCADGELADGRNPATLGIGVQRRADFLAAQESTG